MNLTACSRVASHQGSKKGTTQMRKAILGAASLLCFASSAVAADLTVSRHSEIAGYDREALRYEYSNAPSAVVEEAETVVVRRPVIVARPPLVIEEYPVYAAPRLYTAPPVYAYAGPVWRDGGWGHRRHFRGGWQDRGAAKASVQWLNFNDGLGGDSDIGYAGDDSGKLDRVGKHATPVQPSKPPHRLSITSISVAYPIIHPPQKPSAQRCRESRDQANRNGQNNATSHRNVLSPDCYGHRDRQEIAAEHGAHQLADGRNVKPHQQKGRRGQQEINHRKHQDDGGEQGDVVRHFRTAFVAPSGRDSWRHSRQYQP